LPVYNIAYGPVSRTVNREKAVSILSH
jgi:hypothetical protein